MKNLSLQLLSVLVFLFYVFFSIGCGEEACDCTIPSITIPSYADSFDDVEDNWEYVECEIAQSDAVAEKIHVYVFHNSKISKYRCELRYSWPGEDCRMSSKNGGMNAISTADISESDYNSGDWKDYSYWSMRMYY